jgi:threonine/homoserine/homoserine lactone efflux protein
MILAYGIGLVAGFVGSIPIAGPIALLVFQRGIAGRFQSGLMNAYGAALAEALYSTLACMGVGALLRARPEWAILAHGFGGIAISLVGLFFFLQKPKHHASSEPERPRYERRGSFALGFTITLFNPTLIATWTATLSLLFVSFGVVIPVAVAPALGVGAASGICSWFSLAMVLLRRYHGRLNRRMMAQAIRYIGLFLIGVGIVQLLLSQRAA